jgi:hypothetical protein
MIKIIPFWAVLSLKDAAEQQTPKGSTKSNIKRKVILMVYRTTMI